MKLKDLEMELQEVEGFSKPNVHLEQYPSSAHLAAVMLHTIHSTYGEIEDKVIVDLGCGPGILGIAASLIGAQHVIGVEIDDKVIEIARKNCEELEIENMDFIQADVTTLQLNTKNTSEKGKEGGELLSSVDTVIMNPPFGTRNKGIDIKFLQKAMEIAQVSVYSLHKTSTREHLMKKAKEWGVKMEVLAQLRWNVDQSYSFHKKKSVDIEVDFIRIETKNWKPKDGM